MSSARLPNRILSARWYSGELYRITHLIFGFTGIQTIEASAFNLSAFAYLVELTIYNTLHIIDYHMEMFAGLLRLDGLIIEELTAAKANPPANYLHSLDSLKFFSYEGDVGHEPVLNHLFGGPTLSKMQSVAIKCMGKSHLRQIAKANFTGLITVHLIMLNECGIETIAAGAFDQIAKTLTTIILVGNPLLTFDLATFRFFLDTWNVYTLERPKMFTLSYQNFMPIECTMDFYRLRNATMIAFHFGRLNFMAMYCKNDINGKAHEGQQHIHPARWHLNHSGIVEYTFPEFKLNFHAANRSLMIVQHEADDYRLFIWTISERTSSERERNAFHPRVQCRRSNQTIESVVVPTFGDGSNLIAACIIHISYRKQSLPLHCRTIRIVDAEATLNVMQAGIFLLIDVILMIVVMIVVYRKFGVATGEFGTRTVLP